MTEPDPGLPPLEQLTSSLDAFLAWVEANREAYGKLVRSAAAIPEVREVVDRVRDMTSARILEGIAPGAPPPPLCGPRCARGCGSWTARSSTGSSGATSRATSSGSCCSGRCSAR